MLERILEGLRDVAGVHGVLVVDHHGAIIAHYAHSIYDLPVLQQVARSIIKVTDSVQLLEEDWEVLTSHFGDGKVVLRHLRTSGTRPRRYVLAVIADQTLNVAFLGVALRVAASKLIAELEAAPPAAQSAAVPVAARSAVSQAAAVPSGDSSASIVHGSEVVTVDAACAAFLAACTRALAASIGPMAKVYVRDAVRKVCAGRAFSRADGAALIAQLSAMLDSPEDRARFERATRAL